MTTSERKKIYEKAFTINWRDREHPKENGMCWSLTKAQGLYTEISGCMGISISQLPEFALLHPDRLDGRHEDTVLTWRIKEHADSVALIDLRQTILAFCIAMCD